MISLDEYNAAKTQEYATESDIVRPCVNGIECPKRNLSVG